MPSLKKNANLRLLVLFGLTALAILMVTQIKPVSQDLAFHHFADNLTIAGIPNFWNVMSNIGFMVVGVAGFVMVVVSKTHPWAKITFSILFLSIVLTGVGSAYYHLQPDNNRLVWDRIPMTLVFMSFLSAAIAQCISKFWGFLLLFPLLATGIGSVLWWHYTESKGAGDLRFYGLVQFYPMLLVPLIFLLFPAAENRKIWPLFGWIIGWYLLAKMLEHFDFEIWHITQVISGHSLKHIAASIATIYFISLFKRSGNSSYL